MTTRMGDKPWGPAGNDVLARFFGGPLAGGWQLLAALAAPGGRWRPSPDS
ncbi:MAG TPA: hypothetical protein VNA31_12475 [bacterium]|nr:hypothetical protein [bacterium]